MIDLAEYAERSRSWLADRVEPRVAAAMSWGDGSDDVAVFHRMEPSEERALLERSMAWQQTKFDAGYGAITWPVEHGGAGLSSDHERAFRAEESAFVTPPHHETFGVTVRLVAPTVRVFGTSDQQRLHARRFVRAEELCCQLFSEPEAGSDLAGLGTRVVRDGDEWLVRGQKVWSSGAQFAAWGLLIARSDPAVPKHAGLTAFLVPMDAPGVTIRPIRQMSGGASFSEVFFDDVRVSDRLRLGAPGQGWKVALTTLGFERSGGGGAHGAGGSWDQLLALARYLGRTGDPVIRQKLAAVYARQRLRTLNVKRVEAAAASGQAPGPEGSIGKLLWVQGMIQIGEVAAELLGPRLLADSGEWGTYCWTEHVLGAPGYRIAGGSDEVQRNIISERVLGLPGDVRVDRDVPWCAIVRSDSD
jgi:alkylation response protein AidB-like acyl-CoA dehydrogenase